MGPVCRHPQRGEDISRHSKTLSNHHPSLSSTPTRLREIGGARLCDRSGAVSMLALGLVAAHIADWCMKATRNAMRRNNIDPKGKAVLVTGCDTGFGRKLAARLDEMGYKVYAGCLMPEGEGARSLRQEASDRLRVVSLDVTKDEEVRAAYKTVEQDLASDECLWAVVNNAGIAAFTEIEWCPIAEFRRVYEVNSLGPIRVTKTFLPMLRQSRGRVVLVASLAGRYTFPVHTVEPTLYRTPISQEAPIHRAWTPTGTAAQTTLKTTYGDEYIKDFKMTITQHLNRAKPSEKIAEVIDDMVDAVAGDDPKTRYVPSVVTQIRAKLLSSLPDPLRDHFFLSSQPRTPPAYLTERKKQRTLRDPREDTPQDYQGRHRRPVRMFSMPNWNKKELTPSPSPITDHTETKFKF
ncbi:hypothetical protein Pmani_038464 [Petrolisthes manimaculis]|uniref:Uncharacterized protein n=1 Tax=Petrolisthes manimaculis TaxID=1843537 RepID=A0AAE1NG42_9EUCA|nr:hypothetical protein Pmani_038464 [Petrolisthes manimaculis]